MLQSPLCVLKKGSKYADHKAMTSPLPVTAKHKHTGRLREHKCEHRLLAHKAARTAASAHVVNKAAVESLISCTTCTCEMSRPNPSAWGQNGVNTSDGWDPQPTLPKCAKAVAAAVVLKGVSSPGKHSWVTTTPAEATSTTQIQDSWLQPCVADS